MTRAFLIGAGATKAEYPRAPLTSDFFALLNKHNNQFYTAINNAIHSHLGPSPAPLDEFNIEDVMDLSNKFPPSSRDSFIGSLHSAIYELLASQTESTSDFISKYLNGTIRRPTTLLKTLLLNQLLSENDFFMTLNYDLYLDREILSIQKRIDYGIAKQFLASTEIKAPKEAHFSLYHLHGSLNWELSGDSIQVHLGAIAPTVNRAGSNVCLVPPGKKELNPVLKSIWEVAERRLLQADELILIGCSLNPKDTELIKLVRQFVDKKGDSNVKIIYYDPTSIYAIEAASDTYSHNIGKNANRYNYGFVLNPTTPRQRVGAIEFIFAPTSELHTFQGLPSQLGPQPPF